MTLHVGYVLKMFPRLSETFILNELLELERQGARVTVFSLMHPADGRFHGRLSELNSAVQYLPRDKPEVYWELLQSDGALSLTSLEPAAEFLRRHRIPRDLDLLLRSAEIARRARAQGVAHLHAHFATVATRVAAAASAISGIPFSFTSHAKDIYRETVDRALYRELTERAAFNVTVSDDNRAFLLRETPGISPEKVRRLYNGIDLDVFSPTEPAPSDTPHVVSVGRMVPKKGFDTLLRALAAWEARGGTFQATLIGDGELAEPLALLRDDLGLAGCVRFAGAMPQEEVRAELARASVVALACRRDRDGNQDALPTVLLEALAMDLPVVSTRIGGVPEIVGEKAGRVVEPEEPEAFAAALEEVTAMGRRGAWPAGNGRARAERLFDLRKNVAELRSRFEDSASGSPS